MATEGCASAHSGSAHRSCHQCGRGVVLDHNPRTYAVVSLGGQREESDFRSSCPGISQGHWLPPRGISSEAEVFSHLCGTPLLRDPCSFSGQERVLPSP